MTVSDDTASDHDLKGVNLSVEKDTTQGVGEAPSVANQAA